MSNNIKPIAIYLPQYHPIPENDAAWGEGFTEWTNVKKAKPLFEGHYQPHIPHEDVGYYDLRDPEVLVKQAAMAKEYGIYGFAFYHYWFNGKRLLNLPLDNMLKLGKPNFPFLYIWANEPWSKRWDGSENEVIQEQTYSFEDDLNHIRWLCENVFCDKRYITIDGKPVFVVYRTELFPDIKKTVEIWRNEVKKYGFDGIYLVRVEHCVKGIDPISIGFDAAMNFAPNASVVNEIVRNNNKAIHYYVSEHAAQTATLIGDSSLYKKFQCVCPTWDNTARKSKEIFMLKNFDSDVFGYLVKKVFQKTKRMFSDEECFVFVNAWNEWGEGCHIEPDQKYGYEMLECIKNALNVDKEDIILPLNIESYIDFLEKDKYATTLLRRDDRKKFDGEIERLRSSKAYRLGKILLKPLSIIRNKVSK